MENTPVMPPWQSFTDPLSEADLTAARERYANVLVPLCQGFQRSVSTAGEAFLEFHPGCLHDMVSYLDPAAPITVTSHRRRVGRYIVAAKQALMRLVHPILKVALQRQLRMNQYTLQLAQTVVSLEFRLANLEQQLRLLTASDTSEGGGNRRGRDA